MACVVSVRGVSDRRSAGRHAEKQPFLRRGCRLEPVSAHTHLDDSSQGVLLHYQRSTCIRHAHPGSHCDSAPVLQLSLGRGDGISGRQLLCAILSPLARRWRLLAHCVATRRCSTLCWSQSSTVVLSATAAGIAQCLQGTLTLGDLSRRRCGLAQGLECGSQAGNDLGSPAACSVGPATSTARKDNLSASCFKRGSACPCTLVHTVHHSLASLPPARRRRAVQGLAQCLLHVPQQADLVARQRLAAAIRQQAVGGQDGVVGACQPVGQLRARVRPRRGAAGCVRREQLIAAP